MTLMEILDAITPEQQKKFEAAATEQELDALISEIGAKLTDDEKSVALSYMKARQTKSEGVSKLADEELDNIAGGHGGLCHNKGREVVTVITWCVHGLEDSYGLMRMCDGCEYLLYEKGLWLCNYPEELKK